MGFPGQNNVPLECVLEVKMNETLAGILPLALRCKIRRHKMNTIPQLEGICETGIPF